MHNKEALEKMSCMVELPEESHYYAQSSPLTINSTETRLKTSGTKLFGVMTLNLNFFGHNHKSFIWTGVNKACDEKHTIPTVKL